MLKSKTLFKILILTVMFCLKIPAQERIGDNLIKKAIWKGKLAEYVDREIAVNVNHLGNRILFLERTKKHNLVIKEDVDRLGWMLIEVPEGVDIFPVISDIQKLPFVVAVEPNFVEHEADDPNDPYYKGTSPATYAYQWALKNTGQSPPSGTVDADIDAELAWDITKGDTNIVISILDSGIPMVSGVLSHPDLNDSKRIILGTDFVGDGDGVKDLRGHGTHVTGIAASETNNDTGVAGVARNCKILIHQVFDASGNGTSTRFKNAVFASVDYQRSNPGKHVIISYSGSGATLATEREAAVKYADTNNVLIICPTGNDGVSSVDWPARYSETYKNVVAVGATTATDSWPSYSNYGPQVNISAPGGTGSLSSAIFSTAPTYAVSGGYDLNYSYKSGTSMSVPHVSGTAALMLSINPNLADSVIRQFLENSADKVSGMGGAGWTSKYGYGRLNAYEAVKAALPVISSSNITSNTTWSYVHISGTTTIASGVTVTIPANTTTYVEGTINGADITSRISVYGTLIVKNGTIFNRGEVIVFPPGRRIDEPGAIVHATNGACFFYKPGEHLISDGVTNTFNTGAFMIVDVGAVVTLGPNSKFQLDNPSHMTVGSGASIKLGSGAKIVGNGYVDAQGTATSQITFTSSNSSPSPGNWDGIYLYGGPNTLKYCTINYATTGVYISNSSTSLIDNTTISNCSGNAIAVVNTDHYSANTNIQYSTLQNSLRGLALTNARADLYSCIIKNHANEGISAVNSRVYMRYSKVQNNSWQGVYVTGSTGWAIFGDQYYNNGYNVIYNNDAGLYQEMEQILGTSGGHVYLGERLQEEVVYEWAGYNNVYPGTNFASGLKLVDNQTSYTVPAQLNYWGSSGGPSSNDFLGPIIYSYWKTSPTNSPAPKRHITGSNTPSSQTVTEAHLEKLTKYANYLIAIIQEDQPEANYALGVLASLVADGSIIPDSHVGGWENFLNNVITKSSILREVAKAHLIQYQLSKRNFVGAIELANSSLSSKISDDLWLYSNISKMCASLGLSDLESARNTFFLIESRGSKIDSSTTKLLGEILDIAEGKQNYSYAAVSSNVVVAQAKESNESVSLGNFPNPFNPSTTIEFRLRTSGMTSLKVYDLLGREVAVLVNEVKDAGRYKVSWNAASLPSGVYFSKLDADGQSIVQKLLLVR